MPLKKEEISRVLMPSIKTVNSDFDQPFPQQSKPREKQSLLSEINNVSP